MGLLVNRACLCGCVSALLLTNARGACADPDHFALSNTSAYSSLDILRASAPREQATTTNGSGKAELDRTTSISEIILRESLTRGVFLYETIDPPSSLLTGPSRGDTRPASQPWIGENGADDESFTSALTYRTALSRAISDRPFDSRLGKRFNVMPGLGFEVGLDTLGTSTIDDEVGIYAPYHSIAHLRGVRRRSRLLTRRLDGMPSAPTRSGSHCSAEYEALVSALMIALHYRDSRTAALKRCRSSVGRCR